MSTRLTALPTPTVPLSFYDMIMLSEITTINQVRARPNTSVLAIRLL